MIMEQYRQVLTAGLNSLQLSVADPDIDALLAFTKLIGKWNKVYNLTGIKQPLDSIRLHLLDSLAINGYLQGEHVLDIGTGAGLPGIPLAIINPDKDFVLLDSNAKKTRFVQQAIVELGLTNVSVQHCRIEKFQPEKLFSSIISRAFASTEKFIEVSWRMLSDNGALLAMKGQPEEQELAAIAWPYTVYPITIPEVDTQRCLIKINKRA